MQFAVKTIRFVSDSDGGYHVETFYGPFETYGAAAEFQRAQAALSYPAGNPSIVELNPPVTRAH